MKALIEEGWEGISAFRIAARIGDSIECGMDDEDLALARSRSCLDRDGQVAHTVDPETARALAPEPGPCTMCGVFCAATMMKRLRERR